VAQGVERDDSLDCQGEYGSAVRLRRLLRACIPSQQEGEPHQELYHVMETASIV
jgi:hypothetical protein